MKGIDKAISQIQDVLINNVWQDNSLLVKHYGRTFRQEKDHGAGRSKTVAMIFDEQSKDYKQVMFDDSKDVLTFIDLENTVSGLNGSEQPERDGRIVVAINLKKVYTEEGNKAPELAYSDLIQALNNSLFGVFDVDRIEAGQDAYGILYSEDIKRFDTYPFHVFAVLGTIKFYYNNC